MTMFVGFTPTAMRLFAISATTSGIDIAPGAPDAFTLMPTKSCALKKRAQLSRGSLSPVSVVMPRAIIAFTVGTSTFSVTSSMQRGECTVTTRPRYGPGMPGCGAGLYFVTMR
jgi:hypothetical protein